MIPATVLVIAKEPRPGRAKTRLSPPCTPEEAAAIASAALEDTFTAIVRAPVRRRIAVLDGRPGPWLPAQVEVVAQSAGPFEDRLAAAFACVEGPALLIGMDTPQLTPALVEESLRVLLAEGTDAVLGLAPDGGWWGIGLRIGYEHVFAGVPMSTSETGARQRARLLDLGLRTHTLPPLRDVDDWDDARSVAASMPASSRFARAVATTNGAIGRRNLQLHQLVR